MMRHASPTLCSSFAYAVPHFDGTRDISTGNIEARGREAGNRRLCRVLGVLFTNSRVVDGAKEDGFARLDVSN
jgi:hypothetical protein